MFAETSSLQAGMSSRASASKTSSRYRGTDGVAACAMGFVIGADRSVAAGNPLRTSSPGVWACVRACTHVSQSHLSAGSTSCRHWAQHSPLSLVRVMPCLTRASSSPVTITCSTKASAPANENYASESLPERQEACQLLSEGGEQVTPMRDTRHTCVRTVTDSSDLRAHVRVLPDSC